jgi:hypothetical protein
MFGKKVTVLCLCRAFVSSQQQVFRTGMHAACSCWLLQLSAAVASRWRWRCSSPMGCVDHHDSTRPRGLTRNAPERPSLACLTTSGGELVERKMDAPLSLNVLDGDRGRPPSNMFPLFAVFARLHSDNALGQKAHIYCAKQVYALVDRLSLRLRYYMYRRFRHRSRFELGPRLTSSRPAQVRLVPTA